MAPTLIGLIDHGLRALDTLLRVERRVGLLLGHIRRLLYIAREVARLGGEIVAAVAGGGEDGEDLTTLPFINTLFVFTGTHRRKSTFFGLDTLSKGLLKQMAYHVAWVTWLEHIDAPVPPPGQFNLDSQRQKIANY